MAAADVLILVTDGFLEQANAAGEPFGIARLKQSIFRQVRGQAKDVAGGLYEDVRTFSAGAARADDLTVTVIRRTA
jgi:sigma-B regulation protein RsbU (phosphoserine phosphatase)